MVLFFFREYFLKMSTKGYVTVTGSDLDFRMLPLALGEDGVRGARQDLGGNIKTEEEP